MISWNKKTSIIFNRIKTKSALAVITIYFIKENTKEDILESFENCQNNFSAEHQVLKFKMEVVLLDIGKYTGEINDDGRPHGKGSLR